jgi:hypothetical protein
MVLREHILTTLRRAPASGLTLGQIVDTVGQEEGWAEVSEDRIRAVVQETGRLRSGRAPPAAKLTSGAGLGVATLLTP